MQKSRDWLSTTPYVTLSALEVYVACVTAVISDIVFVRTEPNKLYLKFWQ